MSSIRPYRVPHRHGFTCTISGIPSDTKLSLPKECNKCGCDLWTSNPAEYDRKFGDVDAAGGNDADKNQNENRESSSAGRKEGASTNASTSGWASGFEWRKNMAWIKDYIQNQIDVFLDRKRIDYNVNAQESVNTGKADAVDDRDDGRGSKTAGNNGKDHLSLANPHVHGQGYSYGGHCDGERCACDDAWRELKRLLDEKDEPLTRCGTDTAVSVRRGGKSCVCDEVVDGAWKTPCCGKPPRFCPYFENFMTDVKANTRARMQTRGRHKALCRRKNDHGCICQRRSKHNRNCGNNCNGGHQTVCNGGQGRGCTGCCQNSRGKCCKITQHAECEDNYCGKNRSCHGKAFHDEKTKENKEKNQNINNSTSAVKYTVKSLTGSAPIIDDDNFETVEDLKKTLERVERMIESREARQMNEDLVRTEPFIMKPMTESESCDSDTSTEDRTWNRILGKEKWFRRERVRRRKHGVRSRKGWREEVQRQLRGDSTSDDDMESSGFSSAGSEINHFDESSRELNQNWNNYKVTSANNNFDASLVHCQFKAPKIMESPAEHKDENSEERIGVLQQKFPRGLGWFLPFSDTTCSSCNSCPCACPGIPCGQCGLRSCGCTHLTTPRNLQDVLSLQTACEMKRKDFIYNCAQRQRKLQIMASYRQESGLLDDEAAIFFHHNRRHGGSDVLSTNQLSHPFSHQLQIPEEAKALQEKSRDLIKTSELKKNYLNKKRAEASARKLKYENRIKAELYKEKVLHKVLENKRQRNRGNDNLTTKFDY